MTLGRASAALALSAALSLALSLGISALAGEPDPSPQAASVVWDERPDSVSELAADATVLVEARVEAIEAGPELVSPDGAGASHEAIPTQRISFEALQVLDGRIAPHFKLFKTGSEEIHLEGDPPYRLGETYVLFLEPQGEPGTWIPAAPDGRLALGEADAAEPVIAGLVASELEGKTPEEIERAAR